MTHFADSERARLAQRQRAYKALQEKRASGAYGSSNYSFFSSFTEWRMRRIAPFAMLVHAFAILFLISWFITSRSHEVATVAVNYSEVGMGMAKIEIPESNVLYRFEINQDLPGGKAPLYSELEIEILDENWDHVYSVYKNLWQEWHPNGEGRRSIYRDSKMEFEIELPKAGAYYIRPISHNGNNSRVRTEVLQIFIGGIYLPYYGMFFGALSVLLLLGSQVWGTPSMMYGVLPKLRSWMDNSLFKLAAFFCIVLFIGSWVAAFAHYGYAAGGNETILPTYFYRTNTVIYLG